MSSPPASAVDICNLALDRLGQLPISSIVSPTTDSESVCARHYDQTRREKLEQYTFPFSRKLAVWTPDTAKTPAFGFTNAYPLPGDFIRLMALGDITINQDIPTNLYEMEDNWIFCDSAQDAAGSGSLDVQYIFDAQVVGKFNPLFVKVLVLQLAMNMAYKFTLKQSLITNIEKQLQNADLAAAAVAGQQKPPRRVQRSKIRDIRRSGGIFRDATRIS